MERDEQPPEALALRWPPESLDDELAAIDLATGFFRLPGALHAEVFRRYRIRGNRFWQIVNLLIDQPRIIEKRARECRRLNDQRNVRRDVRGKVRAHLGKEILWARPWSVTSPTATSTSRSTPTHD